MGSVHRLKRRQMFHEIGILRNDFSIGLVMDVSRLDPMLVALAMPRLVQTLRGGRVMSVNLLQRQAPHPMALMPFVNPVRTPFLYLPFDQYLTMLYSCSS